MARIRNVNKPLIGVLVAIACIFFYLGSRSNRTDHNARAPVVTPSATHAANVQKPALRYPKAVIFGDSLTEDASWPTLLSKYYLRKMDVFNRAFSGYNSNLLKQTIQPTLESLQPISDINLIILFTGNEDRAPFSSPQHVQFPKFYKNLVEIITLLHNAAQNARIIVITPTPIAGDWAIQNTHNVTFDLASTYRDTCVQAFRQVGATFTTEHLQLVNLWTEMVPDRGYRNDGFNASLALSEFFQEDKVHFSERGNRLVFDAVVGKIGQVWPELKADAMKAVVRADYETAPSQTVGDVELIDKWLFGRS
ncbi:SGNH hydrolase [Rhizoclosmatium globosum]|uniref:SGNH hydrolase n=1 Tax=Rhizoclosmatium globosum TaxID=329046 RepID=A0A1Y2CAI1_9FUNG|nr:SGNH hydrolase [Rhizoclosmatium globosum]|eukprot:ORY44043.1 SGNH hydrolase [Rhizoclosmatium globosum]